MSRRYALLGNAGSGKTTLANALAQRFSLSVLDLDSVAWLPDQIAMARPEPEALAAVREFCATHAGWVVEGCYANLIAAALDFQPTLLFLNPGVETCIEHCRQRPHEPHKYASRAEQDERLEYLLQWVREYPQREDAMSLAAHRACFDAYAGPRLELNKAVDLQRPPATLQSLIR
jgi:adenylate kinase family enzyme